MTGYQTLTSPLSLSTACCPPAVAFLIFFPYKPTLAAPLDHISGACVSCFRSCTSADGPVGQAPQLVFAPLAPL